MVLTHHPNRSLSTFRGILVGLVHDSILSKVGASGKVGVIHLRMKRSAGESLYESMASLYGGRTRPNDTMVTLCLTEDNVQKAAQSIIRLIRLLVPNGAKSPSGNATTHGASSPNKEIRTAHPNGHFYSPVVDPKQLENVAAAVWPSKPVILGIDFNDAGHEDVLTNLFPKYYPSYDFPEQLDESSDLGEFYTKNSQFSWLDCRAYYVLLRAWRPSRIIEVGSGFSTLLAAEVKRKFPDHALDITCIEPYPRDFLRDGLSQRVNLREEKVQETPLEIFETLERGDVLFIDSSHVSKTGSDVNFLYFEVLPRLKAGVLIHIHDIFLPHEYPRDWVIGENRSWNEQYLLRALLMYSTGFKVLFSSSYAFWRFPDLLKKALNYPDGRSFGGGSIWIERI